MAQNHNLVLKLIIIFRYGEASMHIMKACPNSYNVAFSLSKNSIYKYQFDKKIITLVESGLTQHYLDIENDKLAKLEKSSVSKLTAHPINLASLQAFFAIFLICMGVSIFVFFLEVFKGLVNLKTNSRQAVLIT